MSESSEPNLNSRASRVARCRPWGIALAVGVVLLLALGLRLYRIQAQSLWYDEGWSVHLARSPLPSALTQIASEGHTHPPGYYLLLMLWVRLFGSSVFAVRSLSVLLGTLAVWAIYRLGATLWDRRTGLAAALLLAVAPAHIVYSQETRMYALLVLCFTWLLALLYRFVHQRRSWSWHDWVALVVVETLSIYTHFFALLLVGSLGLWALIFLVRTARQGQARPLRQWLASQVLVALCFLPWSGIAVQRSVTHFAERATAPGFFPFVLQTWSFLMGGHIALYGREPFYAPLATICLGMVASASVFLARADRAAQSALAYLLLHAFLPLALVFAMMQVRPGYHPRYVLMVLIPIVAIVARTMIVGAKDGWLGRALATMLLLIWLSCTGLAGRALLVDGYYVRDNARGVTTYLQQRLPPGAVVLIDTDDWALRYDLEAAPLRSLFLDVVQPASEVQTQVLAVLDGASTGVPNLVGQASGMTVGAGRESKPREAALVKWNQGETDRQDLLPYLLESRGTLAETRYFAGYTVFIYILDEEPLASWEQAVDVRFGAFRLLSAVLESDVPADEAVTMALTWRLESDVDKDYKATVHLVAGEGIRLASTDREMRDHRGYGTSAWALGQEVVNYYTVPLYPGIAPLTYTVRIGVYAEADPSGLDILDEAGAAAGKSYTLAAVELAPAQGRSSRVLDGAKWGLRAVTGVQQVAPGLDLEAYALGRAQAGTGERVPVVLQWQSTAPGLPDYGPTLRLVRDALTLAEETAAPVDGRYPTNRWRQGETVLDWRSLLIPPDIAAGPATVEVAVQGGNALSLGEITIVGVDRLFVRPSPQVTTAMPLGDLVELLGYDLSSADLRAGDQIVLTLYWQVKQPFDKAHVVFTHLLSESAQVVAQHDGAPAEGTRPTTGWVTGEYIVDRHLLQWLAPDYHGSATLEVGLYDPQTGQRLATAQGDSRLLLPSSIMVR